MATDPKMDFRYRDEAGVEVEAYQITKGSRWATQDWPPWLQIQGSSKEVNKVYTESTDPNTLFIHLEHGRFGIEEGAYVIHEDGMLKVKGRDDFEAVFTKVVPIPPRNLDPESLAGFERTHRVEDGKLVKLSPEEIAELPPEPVQDATGEAYLSFDGAMPMPLSALTSTLRPKAEIALELMQDGQQEAGMKVLKQALTDETDWCACAPGQCAGLERWGCREKSPLVK